MPELDGIRTVLIPKDNLRDLEEIDQTVRAALEFVPVETVDQVFSAALLPGPGREPAADREPAASLEETAGPIFVPISREDTEAVLRQ